MRIHTERKINVAIDGPAGAGKSTVARLVAARLGYVYVDTGAMYRAVTLKSIREGVDLHDSAGLASLAERAAIELIPTESGQRVHLDGKDVSEAIRSAEVTSSVSTVSAVPAVRAVLVRLQRDMADDRGVVMDGRDIGTNVLPDAEVKVFLTASVEIRAERRWKEIADKQPEVTKEQLTESIAERDRLDTERDVSPLRQAVDAVLIDSSSLTIQQAAERILDLCRQALEGRHS